MAQVDSGYEPASSIPAWQRYGKSGSSPLKPDQLALATNRVGTTDFGNSIRNQ
jgi:hypothetical protein